MGMQGGRVLGKGKLLKTLWKLAGKWPVTSSPIGTRCGEITPRQSQLVWRVSERGGRGVLRMCDHPLSLLRMR